MTAPTLTQRLRFIDLSFEAMREAHRQMPTTGRRFYGDYATRNPAREALIERLCLEAMEREGLPMSLLPERRSSFADIAGAHPLQGEAA